MKPLRNTFKIIFCRHFIYFYSILAETCILVFSNSRYFFNDDILKKECFLDFLSFCFFKNSFIFATECEQDIEKELEFARALNYCIESSKLGPFIATKCLSLVSMSKKPPFFKI